jgi:histidyl-tRNA synthetase
VSDILPEERVYWHWISETAARVAGLYGYQQIETPVFEDARVFLRPGAAGTDVADKEVYLFEDRGGDQLALRPEGTAGVVRAYLEHGMASRPQPVRLFYIASIFRYDRPQAGRYRVHHQFGVEAFGDGEPYLDAEVIDLLATFYRELGLSGHSLLINSIGDQNCRPAYITKLRDYYRPHLPEMCGDCQRRFETNPLRLLDCKNAPCQPFKAGAPRITDNLDEACQAHFDALKGYLDALGHEYRIEPTLVRGLDYYTRTVFEFQPKEEGGQSTMGAGGRYDGLVEELGGPPTPGVGFGSGIERLIINLKRQELGPPPPGPPVAFIAVAAPEAEGLGLRLARELRAVGIETIAGGGRSLRAQLRQANAVEAKFALILGREELANGTVTVRDLANQQQDAVPVDRLVATIAAKADSGPLSPLPGEGRGLG